MGRNYQNLVGYFNTYYNADKTFVEGYDIVKKNYILKDSAKYADLNFMIGLSLPEVASDAKVKFDLVIEKCSRILNNYAKSSLVDDALFMMGRAYYYSVEYTRAERKFLELLSKYPDSDLINESKIWLGRCFLKNRNEKDALIILNDVNQIAKEEEEDDIIINVNLVLGNHFLLKKDTSSAIKHYLESLNYSNDDDVRGQICYFLGEVYQNADSLLISSDYYFKSAKYSSSNNIRYWGLNKYASIQKKLGKLDLALSIFTDMEDDKKFKEFQPISYYEIALLYVQKNNIEEAITKFQLLDTVYSRTEWSARGYYQMGLIHENIFRNYQDAMNSYQKSKEQKSGLDVTTLADDRYKILDDFLKIDYALLLLDTAVNKLKLPDTSWVPAYDTAYVKENLDSLNQNDSIKTKFSKDTAYFDSLGRSMSLPNDSSILIKRDTTSNKIIKDTNKTEKKDSLIQNNEKLKNIDEIHSQEKKTTEILLSTDSLKNKIDKKMISDTTKLSGQMKNDSSLVYIDSSAQNKPTIKPKIVQRKIDSIHSYKKMKITPPDSAAIAKKSIEKARKEFEMGNLWLSRRNNVDSAIFWLDKSSAEYPKDSTRPKLLFCFAEAFGQRGDKNLSDSFYNLILTEYPKSEYLIECKLRLGIPIVQDIDTVKVLYDMADSLVIKDLFESAIKTFDTIIVKYPKSVYAAKAQYAIGWLNENKLNNNKKAIESYRVLIDSFPKSEYALLVKPRIDTVDKYDPPPKKLKLLADSIKVKVDTTQKKDGTPDAIKIPNNLNIKPIEQGIKSDSTITHGFPKEIERRRTDPKIDSAKIRRQRELE